MWTSFIYLSYETTIVKSVFKSISLFSVVSFIQHLFVYHKQILLEYMTIVFPELFEREISQL